MSEGTKKTLLLVEDEALLAMTEKMQLEKYGYAVKTVNNGEKAIEAVNASTDIDLILMDVNLGEGIDGTDAVEMIQKVRDIPVVFLSSHSERGIVEKTEKITSYGYVVKSSSITVLDASIKMAIKLFDEKEKINALLEEKRRMVIDVSYRTRKDFNFISSFLNLQAQLAKEPSTIAELEDASARVQSIMILYGELCRTADFKELSFKDYLSVLINEIISNFPNAKNVNIVKHIENFLLDANRLQTVGIIINELITNIMKYAFIGKESGLISICVTNVDGLITLSIQDDGNVIPESVSLENPTGLGFQILQCYIQQLDGKIRLEHENGTKIVL